MRKRDKEKIVRQVERVCKGPLSDEARGLKEALAAGGDMAGAREADRLGRAGCGHDVNDLVIAHLDEPGAEKTVECPACGQEITFVVPVFDEKDRREVASRQLAALKERLEE